MLPIKNRLKLPVSWRKQKPDFQAYSPYFKLIAKKISGNKAAKIGFVISAKVGKATVRNRTRRRLTSLLSQKLEGLPNEVEIIFLVNQKAAEANNENLSAEINKILSKIPFS